MRTKIKINESNNGSMTLRNVEKGSWFKFKRLGGSLVGSPVVIAIRGDKIDANVDWCGCFEISPCCGEFLKLNLDETVEPLIEVSIEYK